MPEIKMTDINERQISCPICSSKKTKKHGIKKKKLQTVQRYFCNACKKTFTLQPQNSKTYPLKLILNAISHYNLGYSQAEAAKEISKRFKTKPSQKTISNWINEYRALCTFNKLRKEAVKLYKPNNILFKKTLNHIQPYKFKYHKAKLYLLFHNKLYNNQFHNIAHFYEPLKAYLEKIPTEKFPHHIFTYNKINSNDITSSPNAEIDKNNLIVNEHNSMNPNKNLATSVRDNPAKSASGPDSGVAQNSLINNNPLKKATSVGGNDSVTTIAKVNEIDNKNLLEQRASQLKFNHIKIIHIKKQNQANKLAKLALNLAKDNKQRHQSIQGFMLINDSTTIAVEVPVYLTNWDAGYYRNQRGFKFPLNNYQTPITGHIDILQIRNGLIHILDYKPEADKVYPIEQLAIYALALSRKLNLPLYHFKCAWFDKDNYFEFFPLHVVYQKPKEIKA